MIKILRKNLIISSNDKMMECQGSSGVQLLIEDDGTYEDYITQVHCGYAYKYQEKEVILSKEENNWLIPAEVFKNNGYIRLSIGLYKDNQVLKTNQITFMVEQSPNGDIVLPNTKIWQKIIEDFSNEIMMPILNEVTEAVSNVNENNEKVNQAFLNLGDYKIENGMIYFKKPNGEYNQSGISLAGQTTIAVDNLVQSLLNLSTSRDVEKSRVYVQLQDNQGKPIMVETEMNQVFYKTKNNDFIDSKIIIDSMKKLFNIALFTSDPTSEFDILNELDF